MLIYQKIKNIAKWSAGEEKQPRTVLGFLRFLPDHLLKRLYRLLQFLGQVFGLHDIGRTGRIEQSQQTAFLQLNESEL